MDAQQLKVKQVCGVKWTGDVAISLDATALELKNELHRLTGQPIHTMKLMCSGKILKNELSLKEQRVGSSKASSMLMLMEDLTAKKMEIEETEEKKMLEETEVERTLAAAQDLASRVDTGDEYYPPQTLEIYNQAGQKVHLLPGDQRALTVGMTLHDRGKALVKKGDLKTAAKMFLRAESEGFSKCSNELLEMVDNYGLLCLDIAWTYFKLKDLNNLKDAGWRLQKAQDCLEKTYGRNMERLKRLKGGAAEMVLYVRILLLRAVAAYHNGESLTAARYLDEAEQKLASLNITDEELAGLVAMGFSARDSRIALRACEKSQEAAVTYLINKKEQRLQQREQERKQREERRERHRAGKTATGQWVDIALLKALVDMGFSRKLVTEALRQTNNDEAAAIGLLTESPDVLMAAAAANDKKRSPKTRAVSEDKIEQVTAMGFSRAQAVGTLRITDGDVAQAINLLLEGRGVEDNTAAAAAPPQPTEARASETEAGTATTSMDVAEKEAEPPESEAERQQKRELEERMQRERELQRQTENEILESVEEDADAHLDVPLDEEYAILNEYRQHLQQRQQQQHHP